MPKKKGKDRRGKQRKKQPGRQTNGEEENEETERNELARQTVDGSVYTFKLRSQDPAGSSWNENWTSAANCRVLLIQSLHKYGAVFYEAYPDLRPNKPAFEAFCDGFASMEQPDFKKHFLSRSKDVALVANRWDPLTFELVDSDPEDMDDPEIRRSLWEFSMMTAFGTGMCLLPALGNAAAQERRDVLQALAAVASGSDPSLSLEDVKDDSLDAIEAAVGARAAKWTLAKFADDVHTRLTRFWQDFPKESKMWIPDSGRDTLEPSLRHLVVLLLSLCIPEEICQLRGDNAVPPPRALHEKNEDDHEEKDGEEKEDFDNTAKDSRKLVQSLSRLHELGMQLGWKPLSKQEVSKQRFTGYHGAERFRRLLEITAPCQSTSEVEQKYEELFKLKERWQGLGIPYWLEALSRLQSVGITPEELGKLDAELFGRVNRTMSYVERGWQCLHLLVIGTPHEKLQWFLKHHQTYKLTAAKEKELKEYRTCTFCFKKAVGLKLCSCCQCVAYCDAKCQKYDWSVHKKKCKQYRALWDKPQEESDSTSSSG
eukprot:gb/GEZN01006198.1/.p1 GENE.gb/GEZN01006198.1/~~gb/GEZN01006198.1/.p1  ORF type:complete len:541 (-),score=74.52 gb/GEZN01006198.1/:43-1665(-)